MIDNFKIIFLIVCMVLTTVHNLGSEIQHNRVQRNISLNTEVTSNWADLNNTFSMTEQLIVQECITDKSVCQRAVQDDLKLVKQLEQFH